MSHQGIHTFLFSQLSRLGHSFFQTVWHSVTCIIMVPDHMSMRTSSYHAGVALQGVVEISSAMTVLASIRCRSS
jgi:hypothetical protein